MEKKNWNDLTALEKATTMIVIFMVIAGYALMFYGALVTIGLWVCDHTTAITNLFKRIVVLVRRMLSRTEKALFESEDEF